MSCEATHVQLGVVPAPSQTSVLCLRSYADTNSVIPHDDMLSSGSHASAIKKIKLESPLPPASSRHHVQIQGLQQQSHPQLPQQLPQHHPLQQSQPQSHPLLHHQPGGTSREPNIGATREQSAVPSWARPLTIDIASSSAGSNGGAAGGSEDKGGKEEPGYHPKIEAISPTLPSSSEDTKAELVQSIGRMDREISKVESQIAQLKKKQQQLEEEASMPDTKVKEEISDSMFLQSRPLSIAQVVYTENRSKAQRAHNMLAGLGPKVDLPLYNLPSDAPACVAVCERFIKFKSKLIDMFKARHVEHQQQEKFMIEKYSDLMQSWAKKLEAKTAKKKVKEQKNREYFERIFPELKKQRDDKDRFQSRVGSRSVLGYARTEAELEQIMDSLHEQEVYLPEPLRQMQAIFSLLQSGLVDRGYVTVGSDLMGVSQLRNALDVLDAVHARGQCLPFWRRFQEEEKKMKAYAVIPPIMPESRNLRTYRFINNNSRVEDSMVEHKEMLQCLNMWSDQEKELFREKYLQHPKNFVFIASYLPKKTVAECVRYYYLTKNAEKYKSLLKKQRAVNTKKRLPPKQQLRAFIKTEKDGGKNEEDEEADDHPSIDTMSAGHLASDARVTTGSDMQCQAVAPVTVIELPRDRRDEPSESQCCVSCGASLGSAPSHQHVVSRANCDTYGVKETDLNSDMRVCSTCWRNSVRRRYLQCPVSSCRTPKRRVKRLRQLPLKWADLPMELKDSLVKELGEAIGDAGRIV